MKSFYTDVVGLPILKDFPESKIVFFEIGPGHGGHTTILALFDNDAIQRDVHDRGTRNVQTGATSSLHHLALTVDYDAQPDLCEYLDRIGVSYSVQHFDWIGWRGVFIKDPEGNTVEFVAGGHRPT